MAVDHQLFTLLNPLISADQLTNSRSQLDGIPQDLEYTIRYKGALLTQAAGILLRLPQEILAQAIVTFTRFYVGPEGGSFKLHSAKDISAASLYLTAKISSHPQSPRSVLTVYAYLLSSSSPFTNPDFNSPTTKLDPTTYYLSEGTYATNLAALLKAESLILRTLSFTTHVVIPHHLGLTYLQTLGVLPSTPTVKSSALAKRTLAHLNTALLSPQLLYLTHQPPELAVAAIYLAAREVGIKLPSVEWWEVFDVEREVLGFLVVAMGSSEGWVREVVGMAGSGGSLLTIEEVQREVMKRQEEDGG